MRHHFHLETSSIRLKEKMILAAILQEFEEESQTKIEQLQRELKVSSQ